MPRLTFKSENKPADNSNFPRLKLDQDETARVAVYEAPHAEFVHNLRKPTLEGGAVKYITVNGKNGSSEQQMDFTFVTNPICLGDYDTVEQRGVDGANCPACKAVQEAPDMFQAPKRRYAMHVFQYTTNGTSKPTKNFQGSVKIWAFTDMKFREIIDLGEEATDGDIENVDLILGPCENKGYQKFKMISSPMVKWKESESTQENFKEIIADNKVKDLIPFIGRQMDKSWMQDKIDEVKAAWRVANNIKGETANDGLAVAERNPNAGLDNILESPKKEAAPATESKRNGSDDEAVDLDDLLANL